MGVRSPCITHSETTYPNCHHFIPSHVILFVKSNLIHKKNCEIHTSYFRIWLLEPWKLNGIGNQNQTFDLILFLVNLINQKIVVIFLEEYSNNAGWVVTQYSCIVSVYKYRATKYYRQGMSTETRWLINHSYSSSRSFKVQ